jgi:AcrR family transcriptional regulator
MSRGDREERGRGDREERGRGDREERGRGDREERGRGDREERSRRARASREERAQGRARSRRPRGAEDQPIWARPEPGERRPAYTREQIAETAIAIADAEGFEAVSMRRIATELGAGTMTLYYYVRTKDELIALMDDAIMGELVIPDDELPDGWREGLAVLARRTHELFLKHPWSLESLRNAEGGPNGLRHVEQSLAIAARTGLPGEARLELTALIDDYVFGHVMRTAEVRRSMGDAEEAMRRMEGLIGYFEALMETGAFPNIERAIGRDVREGFARVAAIANDEGRFERGLQILLDGIELDLERRGVSAP